MDRHEVTHLKAENRREAEDHWNVCPARTVWGEQNLLKPVLQL